jgi:hypothetical protein
VLASLVAIFVRGRLAKISLPPAWRRKVWSARRLSRRSDITGFEGVADAMLAHGAV